MKKKLLDLVENHVDKLIIGVIAILTLAMLWLFIISNPYAAKLGVKKVGPGDIDRQIKIKAQMLEEKIRGDATVDNKLYRNNFAGKLVTLMDSTVKAGNNIYIPLPGMEVVVTKEKRSYKAPALPPVTDIIAENIRTAVFMPTDEVDMEVTYDAVATEVADIDLVSVQVSFNTAELYDNFQASFSGSTVPPEYRDKDLAVPVFAAVELQRQQILDNGLWSDWEKVEKLKIDSRKEMFDIPQDISEVDLGGIDLLLMNFEKFDIQKDLLQPRSYDIAASNAEWLSPKYHIELVNILEKETADEKKEAQGGRGRKNNREMNVEMMMGQMGRMGQAGKRNNPRNRALAKRQKSLRNTKKERTAADVRDDHDFIQLTDDLDLETLREPIFIWAHDDTITPDNIYRYRMKLGVFNPTAGKGWLKGSDAEFNNDVVLWTDYSDVTEEIQIEPMIHIFPLEVAKGNKKAASIQVSKFYKGKWQSEKFDVLIGESIGKVIEVENEDTKPAYAAANRRSRQAEEIQTIDYNSGAILVDIIDSGRPVAGRRPVKEILYSQRGGEIMHLGVKKSNWPKPVMAMYNTIEEHKDLDVQIYKTRGQSGARPSRPGQQMMDEMMMDPMMMGEMMIP